MALKDLTASGGAKVALEGAQREDILILSICPGFKLFLLLLKGPNALTVVQSALELELRQRLWLQTMAG